MLSPEPDPEPPPLPAPPPLALRLKTSRDPTTTAAAVALTCPVPRNVKSFCCRFLHSMSWGFIVLALQLCQLCGNRST